MANISSEQAPSHLDADLISYLDRMRREIQLAFNTISQLSVLYVLPAKPQVGKIYYFGAAIPTTAITAEGYWGYKSTGWVQIA